MPNNLISCDSGTEKIYLHSGISAAITDSFSAPSTDPTGLTYDGSNLVSGDYLAAKIYIHSGISLTITTSFNSPSTSLGGLAYDGSNLISCDAADDDIYLHSGISSTITSSFSAPSLSPSGLTYDGSNLISIDYYANKIYLHSGISPTITTSFDSPSGGSTGLTYDGSNLISCDQNANAIFLHSGISSTITSSFASPSGTPKGLTFELLVNHAPTAPTSLEVDGESSPTGGNCVTTTPLFTAIFNDPDAGDQSNAIEIEVGTASGLSDMWDSGWLADSTVEGNRCSAKTYDGAALSQGTSYWWHCRFRDDDDAEGAWSDWQQFDVCAAAVVAAAEGGLLSQIW
ncbi:hypothetical protein ES703_48896 [subsurface metagenome]